ncbi:MAG TPA: 5-(carboxyamino)imidazole ribonucleotide synthase [Acidimicrobiales bacterium]|nr:5-(carboxyamino)imidazole ribonucleotide synthase [Acidimicrobiales bacterium]
MSPAAANRTEAIGIVGAGQLARMMAESASALGLRAVVLAERPDDSATAVAAEVVPGVPSVAADLTALAARAAVVTFDHEQVDLDLVAAVAAAGTVVRPGVDTLRMATDKAEMRRRVQAAGLPGPAFEVLAGGGVLAAVEGFAGRHGWPVVLKAARGGYDGKGVWPVAGPEEAARVVEEADAAGTPLLVEEQVAIDAELAVVVARRPGGQAVTWTPVETAQVGGVCREVLVPGRLDPAVVADAAALGAAVAEVAGATGVLAVELFWSAGRLLVNEVAARPHNSGHWTIEGAVTSQFENHLRAVLDLPLGSTAVAAPAVATVNVFGGPDGADPVDRLAGALAVDGAHVHLYGKEPRPGRKLGHVTVCGEDPDDVRHRAWTAARALGTVVPAGIDLDEEGP